MVARSTYPSSRISGRFSEGCGDKVPGYDVVQYSGAVRDEGLEIAGTWTVPGSWSGTFLMIRTRGLVLAAARTQAEKV